VAALTCLGAPKDDLKNAAKKLSEAPNYSWSTKLEIENVPFTIEPTQCKTEKGGYTVATQAVGDQTVQVVLKGDKAVAKTAEGWRTAEEIGRPTGFEPTFMATTMLLRLRKPDDQFLELLEGSPEIKAGPDGVLAGELSEEALKKLMTFGRPREGGQGPPLPKDAKGSCSFWTKDGMIIKCQTKLQATFTSPDGEERKFASTSTVEIKDVGVTKVEAPAEAKQKLESLAKAGKPQ
jgi:hypothetical protein